jgi:hypothetical protein
MRACPQVGAGCGLLVGHCIRALTADINSKEAVSLSTYAVVGAAAFVGGCVRFKATAVLITVEATGAWFLLVPVTIAGKTQLILLPCDVLLPPKPSASCLVHAHTICIVWCSPSHTICVILTHCLGLCLCGPICCHVWRSLLRQVDCRPHQAGHI